jgi:hypothetical protein
MKKNLTELAKIAYEKVAKTNDGFQIDYFGQVDGKTFQLVATKYKDIYRVFAEYDDKDISEQIKNRILFLYENEVEFKKFWRGQILQMIFLWGIYVAAAVVLIVRAVN